ncbi:unnamed protein product [Ambrosiozyma monospora]|uniref:Unnamed protein product n=1 Tax=Ambrosiozyma monospora TaxID=43982 RepID=A0ACB5TD66_AMBMO|nr:unnamed protein product [Ambrosiozyma monospora]
MFDDFSPSNFSKYSRVKLFTPKIRSYIHHSLAKYPFLGVASPTLPTNETLNHYIDQFQSNFLNHHPFIHKSTLNEYAIMKSALNGLQAQTGGVSGNGDIDNHSKISAAGAPGSTRVVLDDHCVDNTRVSLVCLPLLIATIGAIVSNDKVDAANLYEASRRCIHVYLETRKKLTRVPVFTDDEKVGGEDDGSKKDNGFNGTNSSPLWLIQSLTLSVIYGLFADEEISLNVIIRQVNALNSLIKTSGLNLISFDYSSMFKNSSASTTNGENDASDYFEQFVTNESTVRTIHMIFHISTLLSTLYNIVPSLKIDDLLIDLPCSTLLWDSCNSSEFGKIVESFEFEPESYQDVLQKLLNLDFNKIDHETGLVCVENQDGDEEKVNFLFDHHVSEFGLICIQNGLHQLAYFKQLNCSKGGSDNSNSTTTNDWFKLVNIGTSF